MKYPSLASTTCTVTLLSVLVSACLAGDNCHTLRTTIPVTKEKIYEYNGRKIRLTCFGEVSINKCEGSCTSQVSPSVVHFPGFKKDCKCCRETALVDRLVTLRSCFEGSVLVPGQVNNIFVKEPSDCECYDCAI